MENKDLTFLELNIEEMLCLSSFVKTAKHYNINPHYYHFGTYQEQSICITKNDSSVWEVYCAERGNIFAKKQFENCVDACLDLLYSVCDSKKQYLEMTEYYKNILESMKNNLNKKTEEEFIPQISNHLLELKKSKK